MEFKSIKELKTYQDIRLDSIKKCEALMICCGSTVTGHELSMAIQNFYIADISNSTEEEINLHLSKYTYLFVFKRLAFQTTQKNFVNRFCLMGKGKTFPFQYKLKCLCMIIHIKINYGYLSLGIFLCESVLAPTNDLQVPEK